MIDPKVLEIITLLDNLKEKEEEDTALIIAGYFNHKDYLVRSKAFAMASLLPHPAFLPFMSTVLQEDDEEFRLRAIEVLQEIGSAEALQELTQLLKDKNPLIVRGAVVALGGISSPESVQTILEFASSPQGRLVRPELVQEAVSFALQDIKGQEDLLIRLQAENANIRRYLRGLDLKRPEIAHFTVYPSADYFSLQAKERGVEYRAYKYLVG
jgi:HEAT repeat protein